MRAFVLIALLGVGAVAAAQPTSLADQEMGRSVQKLLRAHHLDIASCVGAGNTIGEALLDVHVGDNGSVALVRVLRSDPSVQTIARCVADRAKTWSLASLGVETGDQVVIPLAFRPEPKPIVNIVSIGTKPVSFNAGLRALAMIEGEANVTWDAASLKGKVGLRASNALVTGLPLTLSTSAGATTARVMVVEFIGASDYAGATVIGWSLLPVYTLAGGRGSVQLGLDNAPALPFAFDRLTVKAGVEIPRHQHAGSTEIIVALDGRGVTKLNDAATATATATATTMLPGVPLEIPPNTPHSLTTETEMTALQIYFPRGPEQRFKSPPSK